MNKKKMALSLALIFILNILIIYMLQSTPLTDTARIDRQSVYVRIGELF